ncbi:ATP-grasp domain-containing protein [Flavobacterium ustbae]|uniref:hypothetical protein n=1 Tax=Flavobacterium ustbae TaxID=2488790 RepID=UPI000F77FB30|nr:hypothetical protein [Flavobacterium ustbae]
MKRHEIVFSLSFGFYMILVINGQKDQSTDNICKWLMYYEKEFIRIDENSYINKVNFDLLNEFYEFEINNVKINLHSISSVFYKNGTLNYQINTDKDESKFIIDYNANEWNKLRFFLHFLIEKKAICLIGNIAHYEVNKLEVLTLANEIGLKIPESFITSSKDNVCRLLHEKKQLITKSIGEIKPFYSKDDLYLNYTREINLFEKMSDNFVPSLLQVKVDKKYEIRTFFIKNRFWSIAIFSQENQDSIIDNRIINSNHITNFQIPADLESKIVKLATLLNLNSGSVDWIYSTDNNFYFLEINPLGVFNNVSYYGNYNIEKEIAKLL